MISLHTKRYLRFLYRILLFFPGIFCYNVDTDFPILYEGTPSDYFGYSVALLRNTDGYKALITAPRANSSEPNLEDLHQPGVLRSCDILLSSNTTSCEEVFVERRGNVAVINHENAALSYKNILDDMWLGVSLDVQRGSENNSVVVCGHLWKDEDDELYRANGVCYVINSQLDTGSVMKLVPFVNKNRQVLGTSAGNTYFYAFAQAGTSATFSEDGQYLLLGSPGFDQGTGVIVSYKLDPGKKTDGLNNPTIPLASAGHLRSLNGYSGYSVTTGKFYGGNITYSAVGAPRDSDNHGKVFIFMPVDETPEKLVANETKGGEQVGEYFGASVCGTDLNNDGFADLLVGAPFFSDETDGDYGKVYVYISSGTELEKFTELFGQRKRDARFGTTVTDIGDLNQDGFNDVAIGAPYEDGRGAVYIYHGTSEGLNTEYAQRLGAEDIRTNQVISGFGISISRGLDIDDNSYLDLLIGSYSSSNAVLLRSHPVVRISSELRFDPPNINRNITACDFEGKRLSCFNVTYCLRYSGQYAPSLLGFKTELSMDAGEQSSSYSGPARGFMIVNDNQQTSASENMQVQGGPNGSCFQKTAYIHSDIKDEITPVQFFLSYTLDYDAMHGGSNDSFCKECPVIDRSSSSNASEPIRFLVDCGPDNKCHADLVVEAHVVGNPNNEALIIGQNNVLTLDVTVRNRGETAYAPMLSIHLPPEIFIVNQDICVSEKDQQEEHVNTTLRCDFGNPIKMGKVVSVQIKIDAKRIPIKTSSLNVFFEVTTKSDEVNESDNKFNLSIFFKAEADISITGFTDDEQIPYKEDRNTAAVTHKYYVKNYGPSPVDSIDIYLYVPTTMDGNNGLVDFLTFIDLEADDSEMAVVPKKCTSSSFNIKLLRNRTKRSNRHALGENDLAEEETQIPEVGNSSDSHVVTRRNADGNPASTANRGDRIVDCETATCAEIHCVVGPFPGYQQFTKITFSAELNTAVLNNALDSWNRIEFITKGNIFMEGAKVLPDKYPDEIKVKTVIMRPGPPPPRKVETWIIVVSVFGGVLLLFIILIVLFKMGFFKRQKLEEMKNMFRADLKELVTVEDAEPTERNPLNDPNGSDNNRHESDIEEAEPTEKNRLNDRHESENGRHENDKDT